MEKRTKEVRRVSVESTLNAVMDDLAKTLAGVGPALSFGAGESTHAPESIAILVTTSGSTGSAKQVGLSGAALLASARASNKYLGAHFGDTWSLLLPLTHIAGINVLLRSLELGTIPVDLRNATTYPKTTFTAIVPTQLFRALNGDTNLLHHLQSCRAVLIGGAAVNRQMLTQAQHVGINLITTYGMTETSGGCVYDGVALAGVEIEIRDGLIALKGSMLASTYLNDESSWQGSFVDGWFLTQDFGLLESGILEVLGRTDDVIITGGEKISLASVENILAANFPEHAFAAFPISDSEWGAALHVAIVGQAPIADEDISDLLNEMIGPAAKPKGLIRLTQMPLTDVGKIDKQGLIAAAEQGKDLK